MPMVLLLAMATMVVSMILVVAVRMVLLPHPPPDRGRCGVPRQMGYDENALAVESMGKAFPHDESLVHQL